MKFLTTSRVLAAQAKANNIIALEKMKELEEQRRETARAMLHSLNLQVCELYKSLIQTKQYLDESDHEIVLKLLDDLKAEFLKG